MPWSSLSGLPDTMLENILHGILLVFGSAMLLFLAGFAGWQFGMSWVAAGLYALAAKIIWLAFILLSLLHTGWVLRAFWQGLLHYFHGESMALRRVAMLQIRQRNAGQRLLLERLQLHYQSQIKRQRLLAADDKKQNADLFKAISAELCQYSTPVGYKALRKELRQHHKQANPQAMLALRAQVLCQSSSAG